MTTQDLVAQLLLGGILGMLGQGIRVIVGLKKQGDKSAVQGNTLSDDFNVSQFFVSLFIGFIAGAIGIMTLAGFDKPMEIKQETAFSLLGIGYAGADFIEGFMSKYLPSSCGGASADTKVAEEHEHPAMG